MHLRSSIFKSIKFIVREEYSWKNISSEFFSIFMLQNDKRVEFTFELIIWVGQLKNTDKNCAPFSHESILSVSQK